MTTEPTEERATANPPAGMACAVCGLVLNRRVLASADGLVKEWTHNRLADHPNVPVAVGDIRTNFRCDFCLADNVPLDAAGRAVRGEPREQQRR